MPKVSAAYKEERRALLLQSALHCFAEKGFEATTIDHIVKHGGVSKGAVYHYFKSKEEIYLELIEAGIEEYFVGVRAVFEKMESTIDKLRCLFFEAYETDCCIPERRNRMLIMWEFWIYSSRQPETHEMVMSMNARLRSFLTELIEEGKSRGEFRADVDAKTIALLFWSIRNGIGINLFHLQDLDELKRCWQEMEQILLNYLT